MPTYEPRIWRVRIWRERSPIEGTPFVFKVPAEGDTVVPEIKRVAGALAEAEAHGRIRRFQLSPVPARVLKTWTKADRLALQRFAPAFAEIAEQLGIEP